MELKNILSKLSTSKETESESFLALEISTETVKSAVWAVEEGKTVVLKIGSIEEWKEEDKRSLIAAVDSSISNACEGIEPEPNKVIFGLPESWVREDQIIDEKKDLLKDLCDKLEWQPLGFVVTLEALITFLKEKEGTPVSAIFINLSETQSIISLVKLGKIKGSKIVGRSDDLAADVREGLARLGQVGDLPSRMILFNGVADFEEAKQQLISFDWQEQLPFLHFPKVEVLEVLIPVKAVALAGGAEVAKSLGFKIKEKEKEEVKEVEKVTEKTEVTAADLGFVQDKDITKKAKKIEKVGEVEKKPSFPKTSRKLINLFTFFKKIPFRLPKFSIKIKKGPIFIILPILFFSLFIIGGLLFYWYVPKAVVTLYLKPKVLEKEFEITIDSTISKTNKEEGVIPGSLKEVKVEGTKIKETTGEKLVGEKAKGEVIIYNKTDMVKVFPAGTVLIGPNKLTFSLDGEIEVASKSAQTTDEGEQITYGKTTASVTATSIGPEFNLSSQTQFSFKEYPASLYSAKTENGFSGGTSRQIRAVSEEDQSSLLEDLTSELKEKAKQELRTNISSGEKVLDQEISSEILNQEFSAEEGEEVDNLSLDLEIKFTFLAYQQEDLKQFLEKKISDSIPSGFVFEYKTSQVDIKDMSFKDNKAKLKVVMKSSLLPKLDIEEIKKNLKGHYPEVIQTYLESLPNFSRADIKITPKLPAKLRTLPRKSENIKVEIQIEK